MAEYAASSNQFGLMNYPNPFTSETIISFSLEERTTVNLSIFDVSGKLHVTPINNILDKGYHEAIWKANDEISSNVIM